MADDYGRRELREGLPLFPFGLIAVDTIAGFYITLELGTSGIIQIVPGRALCNAVSTYIRQGGCLILI